MKEDGQEFQKLVNAVNSGKKYPALKAVSNNPQLASVISKLIKPRDKSDFDIDKPNSYYNLDQSQIEAISSDIKGNIGDSKNIVQLFPDIELAIQILVSSILSPKDMVNSELLYKNSTLVLNSELSMKINTVLKDTINTRYKLNDKLELMLRETLFTTGSYIEAVLPESIVDEVINFNANISTESLSELFDNDTVVNLGILGNSAASNEVPHKTMSLESMLGGGSAGKYDGSIKSDESGIQTALETLMDVTDNYGLLKLPLVTEAINKGKIRNIIKKKRISLEDDSLSSAQLATTLYKDVSARSEQFMVIPNKTNAKRKSVGRPLVMKLPSESVIPVYIPGDETKHVGYFVLIDVDGNPVTIEGDTNLNNGLTSLLNNANKEGESGSLSSMLINKAKQNLVDNSKVPTLDGITKVYSSIIEKDLVSRLKNGLYSSDVEISGSDDIYRIMLSRALSGHYTRLVYMPEELVSYFAFNYHDNGVGKSLLDDIKILTSLRAIIMFAKVMALTKNSIAMTRVNMTLDPNDPDPQKTIELATHEVAKTRQQYFPLGINSPVDLVDWIQRAGFEFTFEGHPGLPETKFDFETKNIQRDLPDSDLDELLRKQTYMAFGLSPEVVDNGFSGEFATTVVSNNILLSKRVMQRQKRFTAQLTEHVVKIANSDPILEDELVAVVESDIGSLLSTLSVEEKAIYDKEPKVFIRDVIERHLETLEVDLPKPDGTTLDNQVEAYDQYSDSLETAIEAWITSDSVDDELAGRISSNIDTIKSVLKNYFLRRWMSNNGYMTELSEITSLNEDGDPSIDIYEISKGHLEGLIRSSVGFIDAMTEVKNDSDSELDKIENPEDTDT